MKLSSMFLLGVGLMCLPVQAQFHPIGSTKPLPESAVPNIVMAVEDEIYDYKQEKSFVNIGSTGAIGVATQVPIYIAKSISDRNIGWVLYKDMPHGEVLRRFIIQDDGLVVLYGDPELDFPAQQPDTKAVYLDDEDICQFIGTAMKKTFTVDPNVSNQRIADAEKRQMRRVHYSFRLDQSDPQKK
jgi:hypothetical protein